MRSLALVGFALALATPLAAPGRATAETAAQIGHAAEWSSAKRNKRQAQRRPALAPAQIACTHGGCGPVPVGCSAEKEIDAEAGPTGFEVIVCPAR